LERKIPRKGLIRQCPLPAQASIEEQYPDLAAPTAPDGRLSYATPCPALWLPVQRL